MQKYSFFKKVSVVILAMVLQIASINCSDQTQTTNDFFELKVVNIVRPGVQMTMPAERFVHLRIDKDPRVRDERLKTDIQEAVETAFDRFQDGRPSDNVLVYYESGVGNALIWAAYGFSSLEEAQNHEFKMTERIRAMLRSHKN